MESFVTCHLEPAQLQAIVLFLFAASADPAHDLAWARRAGLAHTDRIWAEIERALAGLRYRSPGQA